MGPSGAAASEVARRDSFLHGMCCYSCGGTRCTDYRVLGWRKTPLRLCCLQTSKGSRREAARARACVRADASSRASSPSLRARAYARAAYTGTRMWCGAGVRVRASTGARRSVRARACKREGGMPSEFMSSFWNRRKSLLISRPPTAGTWWLAMAAVVSPLHRGSNDEVQRVQLLFASISASCCFVSCDPPAPMAVR